MSRTYEDIMKTVIPGRKESVITLSSFKFFILIKKFLHRLQNIKKENPHLDWSLM